MGNAARITFIAYMVVCIGVGGFNRNSDVQDLRVCGPVDIIQSAMNVDMGLELVAGLASLNPCLVPADPLTGLIVYSAKKQGFYSAVMDVPETQYFHFRPPTY
jgi:hypothetical protein